MTFHCEKTGGNLAVLCPGENVDLVGSEKEIYKKSKKVRYFAVKKRIVVLSNMLAIALSVHHCL